MGLPPGPIPPMPPAALVRIGLFGSNGRGSWVRDLYVNVIADSWCFPMPRHAEPGGWLLACAEVARLDPDDPLPRLIEAARTTT